MAPVAFPFLLVVWLIVISAVPGCLLLVVGGPVLAVVGFSKRSQKKVFFGVLSFIVGVAVSGLLAAFFYAQFADW